jgi:hypothetical protein
MEQEICEINELEEKEFSEENISDTSYEESEEDKKDTCPTVPEIDQADQNEKPKLRRLDTIHLIEAAKASDRVRTSNQLALVHLRQIYSPEIREIIKQSEQSILELFELISSDCLNIEISNVTVT